jgi:phosphoribosylaminoimidazole-succinocarboxamide synthase
MSVAAAPKNYGEKIYEGKAKILYRGNDQTILHYFKDSATAFNAQKKGEFAGKGEMNCKIATLLFHYLAKKGIRTHFIKSVDERTFQTHALQMLPIEVVVRNRLAGSLAKRLGEREGAPLNPPVVEFYLKDDAKGDPLVSEDVLMALYSQSSKDLARLRELALEVNHNLQEVFKNANLTLADFKLEFGKTDSGEIILADEISPDTCRLWDIESGEKLDKDRFRFDLGDLMAGYQKVFERLSRVLG